MSAWNVSVNLVYYPAGRSRRSLASPYRPLFDVADNGNMIRILMRLTISGTTGAAATREATSNDVSEPHKATG